MARTRFGRRGNWFSNASDWRSWKKKKPKKKKPKHSSYSAHSWMPYMSQMDVDFISSLVHRGAYPYPYIAEEVILDDEMPHDDLDDEVMFGSIRTDIVGVQYYQGSVNNNEMVCLEREPNNVYDRNAIRVLNLDRVQVGHLKREMAKPLSFVLDNNMARLEGTVPFGANNMYKITVDLTLWGKPEEKAKTCDILRSHGVFMKPVPGGSSTTLTSSSVVGRMGPVIDYSHVVTQREFLSPADVKNELDKLFESLQEGDKTTMTEAAKAIRSPLYPHQKQALNWMISRENGDNVPPFWEKRHSGYFNSLTVSTSSRKPNSIMGGILADDMGLGKTLEMISLILTNFVDKQPLAQPVPGKVRLSKQKPQRPRRKSSDSSKVECTSKTKEGYEEGCPFERIRAIEAEIDSLEDEKENVPSGEEGSSKTEPTLKFKLQLKPDSSAVEADSGTILSDVEQVKRVGLPGIKKLKLKGVETSMETKVVEINTDDEGIEEEMEVGDYEKDQNVMIRKEDKDFKPTVTVPEQTARTSRPRRSVKRPARYTLSDSEEEISLRDEKESRKTEVQPESLSAMDRELTSSGPVKATGRGQGHGRGGRGKGVTGRKGKGKAKSSGKGLVKEMEPSCPLLPQLDVDELPDVTEVADGQSRGIDYNPQDSDDSSDDDLPDIEVPFQCNEAGVSNCDMSTGRTQTDRARATLIICPLSVLSNWLDQLEEHLHENVHLEIYTYYGSSRTKNVNLLAQQDIVLTTYSTLSADSKTTQRPLQKVNWLRVVLDEGHVIRNPKALQTKAVIELKTERRWVLTGTPIQNSMKDLWSLINFLQISPLTDRYWWHRTIERPLAHGDKCAIKRVQHLMGNIALRRTKTTKINNKPLVELPERNVFIERIKLSEEERKVYTAMQNEGRLIISKYFREGTLLHNYGQVLAILMRLRQMCCHPSLVARAAAAAKETQAFIEKMQAGTSSAVDEAKTKLVETLLMVLNSGSDEECSVCLDSLKAPVITPCAHVFCRPCIMAVINNEQPTPHCPLCRGDISENKLIEVPPESEEENVAVVNIKDWQSSAKVDALMKALVKLREEDTTVKSLVVSQFTSFLTLLEVPLRANGFKFARLDGTMTARQRTAAIQEFMEIGPDTPTIFLLSLKAGGVGLNLTAASQVFLMDPAWNPASEDQCFDRCHRLGQTRDVVITKFLVEDSVEERMLQLQENKRQLMQGAFGKKQTAEQQRQSRIKDIKNLINL